MYLKIATYNIHSCVGTDGRFDPARTSQVLGELAADIIALQEVENPAIDNLTLLESLAEATGLTPIAGPTIAMRSRHYGNALLTALPIAKIRRIDLSQPGREPRGALDVTLVSGDQTLRVLATHLGLKPAERREQVKALLAETTGDERAYPSVLLGDINEWALWGRPLRWLRRHFEPTPGPASYPSCCPLLALDRIWARPRAMLGTVETHRSPAARTASDHLPVKSGLSFPVGFYDA